MKYFKLKISDEELDRRIWILASMWLITIFVSHENPFEKVYYFIIYFASFVMCAQYLRKKREELNIYFFYLFKILSITYISFFIYAVVKYLRFKSFI